MLGPSETPWWCPCWALPPICFAKMIAVEGLHDVTCGMLSPTKSCLCCGQPEVCFKRFVTVRYCNHECNTKVLALAWFCWPNSETWMKLMLYQPTQMMNATSKWNIRFNQHNASWQMYEIPSKFVQQVPLCPWGRMALCSAIFGPICQAPWRKLLPPYSRAGRRGDLKMTMYPPDCSRWEKFCYCLETKHDCTCLYCENTWDGCKYSFFRMIDALCRG